MRSIYAAGKTEFISSISWPTGSLLLQTMSGLGFLDVQQQLSLKLRSPVLSGAGAWGPSWPRRSGHYYEVGTIRVLAVGPTTPFLGALLALRAHNGAPRVAPPVGRRPRNCAHTSWRVSSTVLFKVVICDEDSLGGRPLRLCGSRGQGGW